MCYHSRQAGTSRKGDQPKDWRATDPKTSGHQPEDWAGRGYFLTLSAPTCSSWTLSVSCPKVVRGSGTVNPAIADRSDGSLFFSFFIFLHFFIFIFSFFFSLFFFIFFIFYFFSSFFLSCFHFYYIFHFSSFSFCTFFHFSFYLFIFSSPGPTWAHLGLTNNIVFYYENIACKA